MERKDYEEWRQDQYGNDNIPIEQANQMSLARALRAMSLHNSDEEILSSLRDCGLIYDKENLEE